MMDEDGQAVFVCVSEDDWSCKATSLMQPKNSGSVDRAPFPAMYVRFCSLVCLKAVFYARCRCGFRLLFKCGPPSRFALELLGLKISQRWTRGVGVHG